MVRDIVANDAATGFDSRCPLQFAPADGPVNGLLNRRCWFESNSGRHTHADGAEADFLNLLLSVRVRPWVPFQASSTTGRCVRLKKRFPCGFESHLVYQHAPMVEFGRHAWVENPVPSGVPVRSGVGAPQMPRWLRQLMRLPEERETKLRALLGAPVSRDRGAVPRQAHNLK